MPRTHRQVRGRHPSRRRGSTTGPTRRSQTRGRRRTRRGQRPGSRGSTRGATRGQRDPPRSSTMPPISKQGRAQRTAESAREERGGGKRAHDERAGERLVLPDLDDEEHAEEQRTDRRRADEGEREVGGRSACIPRTARARRRAGPLRHAMGEDPDERERGDGGLQQEDGSPVEELGEQAPERRADHGSGDTGAGPQPATCGSRSVQRGRAPAARPRA